MLTFEVIPRRDNDRGGGLARVNGKVRILEGLALPTESDELKLSYYNSMSTWVQVDQLLTYFGLTREQLMNSADSESMRAVTKAIRNVAQKLPTYATVK